jgi:hypothetical protein
MEILLTSQSPQVRCVAQHEQFCGAEQQNSHAELLDLVGDAIPDTHSPVLSIVAPLDGAGFATGASFEIVVDASDDVGIVEIELFANGESVAVDLAPPWSWSVNEIPAGDYDLHAEARDLAGNIATSSVVTIEVGAGGEGGSDGSDPDSDGSDASPPTDTGEPDGSDDGGDGTEPVSDDGSAADAGEDDASDTAPTYAQEVADLGGCVLAPGSAPRHAGLALLVLLLARRRRC